jgi:hypothetical protein
MVPTCHRGIYDRIYHTYYKCKLMYNYGLCDHLSLESFELEGCEMVSKSGIELLQDNYVIVINIIDLDPIFISVIDSIYLNACHQINNIKGQVRMNLFDPFHPESTGFKHPFRWGSEYINHLRISSNTCGSIGKKDQYCIRNKFD